MVYAFVLQGDSKSLRQTLRVDGVNNKEHFLLNNLCLLMRGFKANTGALLWFHFYSAGWKKITRGVQEVFKVCALYLITLFTSSCHCLSDSGEHARTVSDLIKRSEYSLNQFLSCVDWVNVHNTLHMPPKEKNLGVLGRAILLATQQVPLSVSISPCRLCSDVLVYAGWSALELHHVVTTFICISQGVPVSPPWAAEACSGGIPGKLPHSNGLEWRQIPADNL